MASCTRGTDGDGNGWCLFRTGKFDYPVLIPLDRNEIVIGRISNKHLKKSPFVSRKHVCFFKCGDDWHVEDLGSTNGTYLNEVKINSNYIYPVREYDVVGLGMASPTSEEHFSFKLCKHSDIDQKCVEKQPDKQQSRDISFDSTLVSVESCDSVLSQLSTVKRPHSVEHNHMGALCHEKNAKDNSLGGIEPSSMKLRSSSSMLYRDRNFPNQRYVNNSSANKLILERAQTASTARKLRDDSNVHSNDGLHSKVMLATRGVPSCSTSTDVFKERDKPNTTHLEGRVSKSTKRADVGLGEVPNMCTSRLKNSVHLYECSVDNENYAKQHQATSTKNSIKDRKRTRGKSVPAKTSLKLIKIEEPDRKKSVWSDTHISMQNKTKLIDLSEEYSAESNKRKRKGKNRIKPVTDSKTLIMEAIDLKDVITLSDCENDDCLVVNKQLSKPTSSSSGNFTQSKNSDVKQSTFPDPSICTKMHLNPITDSVIEIDESSNDTHISETVDDCVGFEIGKPDLNIDEELLLSRISWPDLPPE